MNTIKRINIIFILIFFSKITYVYATDILISSQLESMNLSSFITQGEQYTKDVFEDLNIEELLKSTMKGEINKSSIYTNVLKLLGKEIVSSVTFLGMILVIVVVHSILKSIGENIGNKSVSQMAYYVQYILIVTLIMSNFSEIIVLVKEAIINLVGYINTLVPLLLALVVTTR